MNTILQAIALPGGGELLLIFLIVLVVFGHNRIPQLGEALGKGIKNFRKSFAKDETELEPLSKEVKALDEAPQHAAEAAQVKQKVKEEVEEAEISERRA
ncbi:twin-arginine translocase TatA/TatE family subunit [Myxococcota bacterium]|nr:twin-arginine translocase TatA/TatE family subunit [Myxococcota bacterium]